MIAINFKLNGETLLHFVSEYFLAFNSLIFYCLIKFFCLRNSRVALFVMQAIIFYSILLEFIVINCFFLKGIYFNFDKFLVFILMALVVFYFGRSSLPYWIEEDEKGG